MKTEWKSWFVDQLYELSGEYIRDDRSYSYKNIEIDEVPFHTELKSYIYSLSNITDDSQYKVYHIHKWEVGDFFDEHTDNHFNRKWAYVCELHQSLCNTSLIVDNNPIKEGIFSSTTLHRLPKIKNGTRISLTVFGTYPSPLI